MKNKTLSEDNLVNIGPPSVLPPEDRTDESDALPAIRKKYNLSDTRNDILRAKMIYALPPEVLCLFRLYGLSYDAIAKQVDSPKAAIYNLARYYQMKCSPKYAGFAPIPLKPLKDMLNSDESIAAVDGNGNVKAAGNFYATDHTNPIGWYDAHNNTTTLSSGTSFVKLSGSDITLAAGRYIITGSVRFNGATSGYRGITIRDSNGSIERANVTQQTIPSSSWTTSLNTTIIYIAQSQTTVSLMAYQNSGSSLGISWDIYAICIK